MEIKVTVKTKEVGMGRTDWKSLASGTVIEYSGGIKGLKYDEARDKPAGVVLLTFIRSGHPVAAAGYLDQPFKVLGQLSECIVIQE